MELDKIPGYTRAVERVRRIEEHWRESAFLPYDHQIRGVTIRQMTLEHFATLTRLRNPFIVGGEPKPEHVCQFLWILSPQHHTDEGFELDRREYIQAILAMYPSEKFRQFYRAIYRYVWTRCFLDMPYSRSRGIEVKQRTASSFAGTVVHRIAMAYGWSREQILQTPLPALFQLINCIRSEGDSKAPQFHPLEFAITQKFLEAYNRRQLAN